MKSCMSFDGCQCDETWLGNRWPPTKNFDCTPNNVSIWLNTSALTCVKLCTTWQGPGLDWQAFATKWSPDKRLLRRRLYNNESDQFAPTFFTWQLCKLAKKLKTKGRAAIGIQSNDRPNGQSRVLALSS